MFKNKILPWKKPKPNFVAFFSVFSVFLVFFFSLVFFARSDWFHILEHPRIFLARMTGHGSDDMASRFPESLSEAQISEINEKTISINKKKATKFGFSVFQYKILLLNIILRVNLIS